MYSTYAMSPGWARGERGMVADASRPAYVSLLATGELKRRVSSAYDLLHECRLCGRACAVDRAVEHGACRTGLQAAVASYGPHHGEEAPLRGQHGSGTVFFSACNLRCCYCQNADISQLDYGREVDATELAQMMLELQHLGCHNINLVSPTHIVPQILAALLVAAQAGLRIPIVYNTGGYDSLEALALLDSVVDIYMPDMKYSDRETALTYSGVDDYPVINQSAVLEMHRQVGDLVTDERGVAIRGLLIRHLVLPGGLAGTGGVAQFLARAVSRNTYLNVMDQYRPAFEARRYPPLDRRITRAEWRSALRRVREAGLDRLDRRESRIG